MSDIPSTMRAFVLTGHGDADKLAFHSDWPAPKPRSNEVLIQVHACGLNNTDINTRTAWYSKSVVTATSGQGYEQAGDDDATWGGGAIEFPRIQGADVAGTVVASGSNADQSLIGKRVLIDPWLRDWDYPQDLTKYGYFGSECDGGFADFACIDHRHACPVNSDLSNPELATFATAYGTAENMLDRINLDESDTLLITGASGGVGSALIQLANCRGARTVAMASETKHEQVQAIGPEAVIGRNPQDLRHALRQAIGCDKVTAVADLAGGEYWPHLIDALQRGGRYVVSGAIAGPIVQADLRTIYLMDLTMHGATTFLPRVFRNVINLIERGRIKPLLADVFKLEALHEAQAAFVRKQHTGNIVVTMEG